MKKRAALSGQTLPESHSAMTHQNNQGKPALSHRPVRRTLVGMDHRNTSPAQTWKTSPGARAKGLKLQQE